MAMPAETVLVEFGFTELESRLYYELSRCGGATGYRLAKQLGKVPANIYQSLNSLTQKGAAVISSDSDGTSVYAATPPDQLLALLRSSFEDRHHRARHLLDNIPRQPRQERVYSLANVEQILERCRTMIRSAERIVLFDMFPSLYDILREEIDGARARGLVVAGIVYLSEHVEAGVAFNGRFDDVVSVRWPGLGLILVTDGMEQMVAQIAGDMESVLDCVWTDNVFLSCIFHSAVASDIRLAALMQDASDPLSYLAISESTPPGLHKLLGE